MSKKHVAVLMGGFSSERPVSLSSGTSCADALEAVGYRVTRVDVGRDVAKVLSKLKPDVAFNALHGPYGEDGTIQGLLELAGVPYVGAGVLASAAGMDKEFTKKLLAAEGLPICDHVVLRPRQHTVELEDRERLGLPVFVKPSRGGSSIGVSRVTAWEQLPDAVARAREHDPKVIVEAAVHGRELECGVLEFPDGRIEASTIGEIRVAGVRGREDGFYDFATKYLEDAAELDVPAKVDVEIADTLRQLAIRAFNAIDCQGLARVDFFLTDDGPVVNEINTMPGFTTISMYPQMWAASGVDYPTLLSTMVETALARGTGLR
jgi:D-alanine-D-alanine ligase